MIDQSLRRRIELGFAPLNTVAAAQGFPAPGALSAALDAMLPTPKVTSTTVAATPRIATMFATAATDIWMRAVHTFLVSTLLTEASPIWSSACGYYSSHYSVRALAHMLGHFQLFRRKRIVRLEMQSGKYHCCIEAKQGHDREHKFYWRVLKEDPHFASDPLFTHNDPESDASDVGHRDRANYADHIGQLPTFRLVREASLRQRIELISQIQFDTPPIPKKSQFPDVEAVQVIAYHRLIKFRQLLDEVLGGSNRFWKIHRSPSWTTDIIDFQLTEQGSLGSLLKS